MFVDFIYELRKRKVPVGTQEAVALAHALAKDLHGSSLDGFYNVARSLLVHSETHLDDFDLVFSAYFRGAQIEAKAIAEELLDWLRDPIRMRELTQEEREGIEALDLEEVRRRVVERLREQKERHDGGNYWIGTGGTSPFGSGGVNPSGIQVGPGGGGKGGAMKTADARKYKPYRSDVILDIRQIEVALRKLRAFAREGRRGAGHRRDDRPHGAQRRRDRGRHAPAATAEHACDPDDGRRRLDGSVLAADEPALQRREARDPLAIARDLLLPQRHLRPRLQDRGLRGARRK